MTIEGAIRTAIEFEMRVRDTYAAASAGDEAGDRFLQVLAAEEQRHVDYLESRLAEWVETGRVTVATLATAVPARARLTQAARELKERIRMPAHQLDVSLETLKRALDVELKTSAFYRELVDTLPEGEPRRMFARVLEIEDGHVAIVSAELDSVRGLGYWFDMREFDLEAG